jgi:hypothetical protein
MGISTVTAVEKNTIDTWVVADAWMGDMPNILK